MKKIFCKIILFSCFLINASIGLKNEGSTCYINATLQCLFACDPLVATMQALNEDHKIPHGSVAHEFFKLMMNHVNSHTGGHPAPFIDCLSKNNVMGNLAIRAQQDSSEFFEKLIAHLVVFDPSIGLLFKVLPQRKLSDFGLKLPVPSQSKELIVLLQEHLTREPVALLPDIVVIALGRETDNGNKNMSAVTYALDSELSIPVKDKDTVDKFQLVGCVFHSGSSFTGGHYTALVKNRDTWFFCDDTIINQLSPQEANIRLNGNSIQTYMFFFQKKNLEKSKDFQNLLNETKRYVTGLSLLARSL